MYLLGQHVAVFLSEDLPSDTNGHCQPAERTIIVNKRLPRDEQLCVFLHEVGHFLWYKLFGASADSVDEESFCRAMEHLAPYLHVESTGLYGPNGTARN